VPSRILRLWNPSASAWEEVGDSRLTAHLAAADPHPNYLTASEADAGYVNVSGDTMTGTLTVSTGPAIDPLTAVIGGIGGGFNLDTDGTWRLLRLRRANGTPRWQLGTAGDAETGSNAGADWVLDRYGDAGDYLGRALSVSRATGAATFGGTITAAGGTMTGNLSLDGAMSDVRAVQWQEGGVNRWALFRYPDPGGNLFLYRYDDAGGYLGTPLLINRATGAATFGGAVTANGALYAGSGTLNVQGGAGGQSVALNGVSSAPRFVGLNSELGTRRWVIGTWLDTETGSNAGSDLRVDRYSDAGASLGTALSFSRATGAATFGGDVVVNGGEAAVKRLSANGVADLVIGNGGGNIKVEPSGQYFTPTTNNTVYLGHPVLTWAGGYFGGAVSVGGALSVTGNLGLFGTAATTKKTVTGSRAGNVALASLLTQLAAYGLITDTTTA